MVLRNCTAIVALMVFTFLVATPLSNGYDFIGPIRDRTEAVQEEPAIEEEETTSEPEVEDPSTDTLMSEDPDYVGVQHKYYYVVSVGKLLKSSENIRGSRKEDVGIYLIRLAKEASLPADDPKYADEEEVYRIMAKVFRTYKIGTDTVEEESKDTEVVDKNQKEDSSENITDREKSTDYVEIDYSILQSGNAFEKLPPSDNGNYVVIYSSSNCQYCVKLISELKGKIEGYTLVVVNCSGTIQDVFYSRWIYSYPSFVVIANKKVRYYGQGYRTLEEFKSLL